jgi:hypothetical protein
MDVGESIALLKLVMEIRIIGKLTRRITNIGDGFVFVDYLDADIFLEDVFVLEDGTEIILIEIKLHFDTKEPLTEMGSGWKCLCRFDNFDLSQVPSVGDWFDGDRHLIAKRKEQ